MKHTVLIKVMKDLLHFTITIKVLGILKFLRENLKYTYWTAVCVKI